MKPLTFLYSAAFVLSSFPVASVADQVIVDDLIVTGAGAGRLCVGFACANGESFENSATIKIKSTVTALTFEDSTSPGTAQTNDWQIRTNLNSAENFVIRDLETFGNPFIIDAGARSSSLHIRSSGNIGLGTALPNANLHIVATPPAGTATLRLEETTGTPQIYELRANNSGFWVQDITANRSPFYINSGAPSSAIHVSTSGNIGIGTAIPETPLHVRRNTGTATDILRLENNGGVVFRLKDTSPGGQEFTFQSNGGIFRIASPAVPGPEFTMDDFGNVVITGQITTAGSCSAGCDRVFSGDYELKPLTEHNAMMWAQGYLPNVGPTPEDGPFNLTEKVGGMLNELEHAHIYIGQLHDEIGDLKSGLRAQTDENVALKSMVLEQAARLAALEQRIEGQ